MKKLFLLSVLFFAMLIFKAQQTSKIIKDSLFGKPKFVKEYVVFLNDSHPYTFMEGDNEYGHATRMNPKNLREMMRDSWFGSSFCRYTNNETFYNKNGTIAKEIWYYRYGKIVDDYDYLYDNEKRLITEKSKNNYHEKASHYFYDDKNKAVMFAEDYYKWENEPLKKYINRYEDSRFFTVTKFDTLTKTDSTFAITNDIWKKAGERSYVEAKDSVYHQKLYNIKLYNDKYKIVEEKFFDYKSDYENKKISLRRHLKYEYDESGNKIKEIELNEGRVFSIIVFENDKIISEEKIDGNGKATINIYRYTKDKRIESKTSYYDDKVLAEYKYEYQGSYIAKISFLDKLGRQNKEIQPTIVIFKYKFDKQKN